MGDASGKVGDGDELTFPWWADSQVPRPRPWLPPSLWRCLGSHRPGQRG